MPGHPRQEPGENRIEELCPRQQEVRPLGNSRFDEGSAERYVSTRVHGLIGEDRREADTTLGGIRSKRNDTQITEED